MDDIKKEHEMFKKNFKASLEPPQQSEGKRALKWFLPISLGIVIIILLFIFVPIIQNNNRNHSLSETTTTQEKLPDTVEYKLATLYAGSPIEKDDITVYQFKELLDKLEKKTVNTRIDIADITVTAQKLLKEHGISKTLLQILNDFNDSIPEEITYMKLEEVASAYMVLMTQ